MKSEEQLLREELLQDSQKMKWSTPDGWEVTELIPVEYALELITKHTEQANIDGRLDELNWFIKEGNKSNHCDSWELQIQDKLVDDRIKQLKAQKQQLNLKEQSDD